MNKIPHFYKNIQGWFDFSDIYSQAIKTFNEGVFVEVGTWKGKSAAFMATEIANSSKNIKFYCIDPWTGETLDKDPEGYECLEKTNNILYEHFLNNMSPVKGYFIPIKDYSLNAAKLFSEASIDFCFIDASHDYKSVLEDINSWFPKIKPNGIIAGHDYKQKTVSRAVHNFLKDKHNLELKTNSNGGSWIIFSRTGQ